MIKKNQLFLKFVRQKFSGGFTLIEVIIAVAIITIGLWFMLNAFILGSNGIIISKKRIEALNYAQQVMENCIIPVEFDDSNLTVSSPSAKTTYNDAASSCFDDTGLNYTRTYDVWYVSESDLEGIAGTATDYKRIQVKITDNKGSVSDIILDTLKTDFQDLE